MRTFLHVNKDHPNYIPTKYIIYLPDKIKLKAPKCEDECC